MLIPEPAFFKTTMKLTPNKSEIVKLQNIQRILFLLIIGISLTIVGCTNSDKQQKKHVSQPSDTIYTMQSAMSIYAYQPVRALQIVDSAVIVGNLSEVYADVCRARIYSSSQMFDLVDSMLGGPSGVRLDSACAIGERLLKNDSVKVSLERQHDVLEILANTVRMKDDTAKWIEYSRQLMEVCYKQGDFAATDALRMKAEIGAALCVKGQMTEGFAKLDSAIYELEASFLREENRGTFDELDALIIALKRKIRILASQDKYAETLPLASIIIDRIKDYEQHPELYHDSSHREPKTDDKRADYIRFYRTQAQSYITAAFASLGEQGSMLDIYEQIENSVREATAREHIAHYNALQKQIEAERQQAKANRSERMVVVIGIIALLILCFAVVIFYKNRTINRKNRLLAKQIAEAVNNKKMYWEEKRNPQAPIEEVPDLDSLTDEQLFKYINFVIVSERLFLDPKLERQTLMERFQLSKERVGAVFSRGSNYSKLTNYLQQLRLEYAAKLLVEQPDKSIVQIATESGFSSNTYFSNCFRHHFSMSPSDYRNNALEQEED